MRGVTFDVLEGDNFGLVGESGCGKSTLSRLLSWIEQPDRGTILFDGQDIGAMGRAELLTMRRGFQLLLQDPYNCMPPHLTVARTIADAAEGARHPRGARSRARCKAVMAEVGLPADLADRLPVGLSAGQRQRINIARALVLEPRLLILDETLSALDPMEQGRLLDLFEKLQAAHRLTYLFISHDLAMVRKVCSRIAVMYLGKIVELADTGTVFFDPGHPYTRALLSAVPALEEQPLQGRGMPAGRRAAEPDRPADRLQLPRPLPARLRPLPDRGAAALSAWARPCRCLPSGRARRAGAQGGLSKGAKPWRPTSSWWEPVPPAACLPPG